MLELVACRVTQEKSDKEIMNDIQAIMRQIASSVTFLPNLEEPCTFDLLAYTSADSKVPPTWGDSDARLIHNPQVVKLRSIDTKVRVAHLLPFVNYSRFVVLEKPCHILKQCPIFNFD
jgi:mitotic spindle assembly checkpoint protein MAD2